MRLSIIIVVLFTSVLSLAQSLPNQSERFIELTGEAELKLDPNILYLSVELKERKRKDRIIRIEELENQLTIMLQKLGIPEENLKAYSTSGKQYDLLWRNSGLLISKKYALKLTALDLFQPLLSELGDADLFSISVKDLTHTEIEKYKNEVRVKAITDAQNKADLIVSATDSKLGQVVHIREMNVAEAYPPQGQGDEMTSGVYSSFKVEQTNHVNFQQIVLHYKVNARFRIE
jgi:uncharacterized protein YggE